MNLVVKIRGQLFEIITGGDWGGGDEHQAMADVIAALRKMKLSALIDMHEALVEEASNAMVPCDPLNEDCPYTMITTIWVDKHICDPIRARRANPPMHDTSYGATLHVCAHIKGETK